MRIKECQRFRVCSKYIQPRIHKQLVRQYESNMPRPSVVQLNRLLLLCRVRYRYCFLLSPRPARKKKNNVYFLPSKYYSVLYRNLLRNYFLEKSWILPYRFVPCEALFESDLCPRTHAIPLQKYSYHSHASLRRKQSYGSMSNI